MDLHLRYLRSPSINIFNLQADNNGQNSLDKLHCLVNLYNQKITEENADISKFDVCHVILCYEYQLVFKDIENRDFERNINEAYLKRPADATKTRFSNIRAFFPPKCIRSPEESLLLRDILILQVALYYDIKSIKEQLLIIKYSVNEYILHDSKATYMEIIECILESLHLHQFLHEASSNYEQELGELSHICLTIIKSLMPINKKDEWELFSATFLRLTKIFPPEKGLFSIWNYFMNGQKNLENCLTALNIMADACFLSSNSRNLTYIHRDIYTTNTFWMIISSGLRSSIQQCRKQAICVMRKAVDSLSEARVQKFVDLGLIRAQLTPFICSNTHDILPIDQLKHAFFVVYETLQKSSYHLEGSITSFVISLVGAYEKRKKTCNECFDVLWLQCILENILRHEDNNAVQWGALFICGLDETSIFTDQFLESFVNALNNHVFLYEYHYNEIFPDITYGLAMFLKSSRAEEECLLDRFLKKISEKSWNENPAAMYHIIYAIRMAVGEKKRLAQRNWQGTELKAFKSLAEINQSIICKTLRRASQIALLNIIPNYLHKIDDLRLLANTLAAFHIREGCFETSSWDVIITWLRKELTIEDALNFVKNTCEMYLGIHENTNDISPTAFALMVHLLQKANLILLSETCPAEGILHNWLSTLFDVNVKPDIRPICDIIEFISLLLKLPESERSDSITTLILTYIRTTFEILIDNMRQMSVHFTDDEVSFTYSGFVGTHVFNAHFFIPSNEVLKSIEMLQYKSVHFLMDMIRQADILNAQFLYGLCILNVSQYILVSEVARNFYKKHFLSEINPDNCLPLAANADTSNFKGKMATAHYRILLNLMLQYLGASQTIQVDGEIFKVLSKLHKCLELDRLIILDIAMIFILLIEKKVINNVHHKRIFEEVFQTCWTYTLSCIKNKLFWPTLATLAKVIINNKYMLFDGTAEFIIRCIDQLFEEGKNMPTLYTIILCNMKALKEYNLIKLGKIIFNCLLYSSVKHNRAEYRAHLSLSKYFRIEEQHSLMDYSDVAVKAQAIILLYRIINCPELNFPAKIVPLIFETLGKHRNKRYFKNSNLHKLKQRLMQILLILEPVLSEELIIQQQENMCSLMLSECNQHSVRVLQEWFLIRIFIRNTNLHEELWKHFAKYFQRSIETQSGCTLSWASIVYHIARFLPNETQKNFIHKALPYVVQCCIGQQSSMRLYSKFILVRLYDLVNITYGDDSIREYNAIYKVALDDLIIEEESPKVNSVPIQYHFYFDCFHPIDHYNLQTIYFDFPQLTNVSSDEWIIPDVFELCMFQENDVHPLQIYSHNTYLSEAVSMYTKSLTEENKDLRINKVESNFESLHKIQKNMIQSKSAALSYSHIFDSIQILMGQEKFLQEDECLIVVASFVTQLTNLDEIALTCEIFGVKTLVANFSCLTDEEFLRLSISAENRLNIVQVNPRELEKYLKEKRSRGWSLIGVAQTANSANLLQTTFEEKTILILGDENDGIPANFIPLFDACVEIPSSREIRSLNVHITAAICIWQYARQYFL